MAPLINKINSKQARIGIIGIGYVGLPLAVEFAKSGYNVVGIDLNQEKVDKSNGNLKWMKSIDIDEGLLSGMDCTVIVTDHSIYDWEMIAEDSKLIVDTRNATSRIQKNMGI